MRKLLQFRNAFFKLLLTTLLFQTNSVKAQVVAIDDNFATVQGKPDNFNVFNKYTGNINSPSLTIIIQPFGSKIRVEYGLITYLPNEKIIEAGTYYLKVKILSITNLQL